ncbi:porin family protein [Rufibacter sediminis]|uniref:PorT family protein n=1 Tax=Rufibacter sediminis TaxID=2762756 RepID=A0ABR6VYE6_9BACT|nr:porin family protein [Rufibacter sediminis]MBC3542253.1 PorT family protein [Rufibacter sediminis]
MKKIILLMTVLLTSGLMAHAQIFTLGVKAGVSSSKVDFKNASANFSQFKEDESITGFHAGVFTRFNLAGFLLQPELLLSSSGGKFQRPDVNGGTKIEEMGFTNLDVPILVGYKLSFLRAYAGPVASVLIDSDSEIEDVKESLNSADWGYQVGAGLDISRLTADVRYERLKRSYTNSNTGRVDFRNEQVILSLGYKLFGN